MKPFNISNYANYNLVAIVGSKVVTDQTCKLTGLTSLVKGKSSSTTGTLSYRGTYQDYIEANTVKTVNIYMKVDGELQLIIVAQTKHPTHYSAADNTITLELDTIPIRTTIGCIDGRGNDLPYSFGKPWVKAVNVSKRHNGSVLETWTTVSEAELIHLFNTYTKLSVLLARTSDNFSSSVYSLSNLNIVDIDARPVTQTVTTSNNADLFTLTYPNDTPISIQPGQTYQLLDGASIILQDAYSFSLDFGNGNTTQISANGTVTSTTAAAFQGNNSVDAVTTVTQPDGYTYINNIDVIRPDGSMNGIAGSGRNPYATTILQMQDGGTLETYNNGITRLTSIDGNAIKISLPDGTIVNWKRAGYTTVQSNTTYNLRIRPEGTHIGTFLQLVNQMASRDNRIDLYDQLVDLLNWRGISEEVAFGDNSNPWNISNVGYVPPLSYGLLKPNRFRHDFIHWSEIPGSYNINTGAHGRTYQPNGLIDLHGKQLDKMLYRNIRTNAVATFEALKNIYANLIDILRTPSNTFRVSIPGIENNQNIRVRIGGKIVEGYYNNGVISNASYKSEEVSIKTTPNGTMNLAIESDAWLEGFYIKITAGISYLPSQPDKVGNLHHGNIATLQFNTPAPREITWVTKVVKQRGNIITLEVLPYYACVDASTGVTTRISEFPRNGRIVNIARELTPDLKEDRLLDITEMHDVMVGRMQIHSSFLVNKQYYYANDRLGITAQHQAYDGIFLQKYQDADEGHHVRWYLCRLDENYIDSSISMHAGENIELYGYYRDIYIVDCRPNINVTAVRCKRNNGYAEIPRSYYNIEYNYNYLGRQVTAIIFKTPLETRGEYWISSDVQVAVDTGLYNPVWILADLAARIGKTIPNSSQLAAKIDRLQPNFTIYGQRDVVSLISDISEQSKLGYYISNTYLKLTYLGEEPNPVATINLDNIENYSIFTIDVLRILRRAKYTWKSLLPYGNVDQYTLNNADTLMFDLDFNNYIYDNRRNSVEFSTWHFNMNSRNWLHLVVEGFMDSFNLEPYDAVVVDLPHLQALCYVEALNYDHDSAKITLTLLVPIDVNGSGAKPWYSPNDFVIALPDDWYGYDFSRNTVGEKILRNIAQPKQLTFNYNEYNNG